MNQIDTVGPMCFCSYFPNTEVVSERAVMCDTDTGRPIPIVVFPPFPTHSDAQL